MNDKYNIYCPECKLYHPVVADWHDPWTDLVCSNCGFVIAAIEKKETEEEKKVE